MTESAIIAKRKKIDTQKIVGTVIVILLFAFILYNVKWSFVRTLDFSVIYQYWRLLLKGLSMTVLVTLVSVITGLLSGIVLAILSQLPFRIIKILIAVHVEIWRSTPLLVQIFWIHFALPQITGIPTPALVSGIIAMTLQSSAYLTEITRSGIESIPEGQWEAAKVLNLSTRTTWLRVILPQALKLMLPALCNTVLSFFKGSTILSVLAISELVTVSNNIASFTFRPIEIITFSGLLFFIIGYGFSYLSSRLEKRLSQSSLRDPT
ncbi:MULTISPECIES: amino acid ABC transporter permease [Sodalis]|uniref:Polar amino acid transport system permease protein n=1 Tax=Sodalis ligni TaxID=2697027 RepID=A0A4R1NFI2_9GAMM|nr:amino acid ABC transporter permease [Sodalis ligni]TCL05679.1 polar amino acid transport system permease protein [Sodalis ligni]